jgi:hypothetical protein
VHPSNHPRNRFAQYLTMAVNSLAMDS